jgi:hypothetical protein
MVRPLSKSVVLAACILVNLSFFSCSSPDDEVVVPVVAEGLFINEIYASGEDWVELYNALEISKDIGGYFIYDNAATKYKIPAGTTIPAKGFLVLLCNDLASGLNTNFKLTSAGETVFVENASGTLIDRVEFPELNAGQVYGRFPDGSVNLAVSGTTTPGTTNGTTQAPAIATVTRAPIVPALNQAVTVTTTLISNTGIASVKLYHRFNGGTYTAVNMTLSGTAYTAVIPAVATTGLVEYYVEVAGSNGKTTFEPATAPNKAKDYLLNTDVLPQLVINEFMAYNSSCCPDKASGTNEFDDWIEIYNKGSVAVNVAGMYLSDRKGNPFEHKMPTDNPAVTTIEPGKYLILWADGQSSQGPLHLEFALSNAGEDVGLYYIDGRKIDEYTFGAQSENTSWGRTTDGAATWKSFSSPTPGQSNQ